MFVKKDGTNRDRLINKIVDMEFSMFDKVRGMDGRAACQDDFKTFYIMRFSQHNLFGEQSLSSYLMDLERAGAQGVNLITNKYSYMMERSDREYFERRLKAHLPAVSAEKEGIIKEIVAFFEEAYRSLLPLYPRLLASGRGMAGGGDVSVPVYLSSELKTYSVKTLTYIRDDIRAMERQKINPLEKLYKTMLEFYGIDRLNAFENNSSN